MTLLEIAKEFDNNFDLVGIVYLHRDVFRKYLEGETIEALYRGEWCELPYPPTFCRDSEYRVKPKRENGYYLVKHLPHSPISHYRVLYFDGKWKLDKDSEELMHTPAKVIQKIEEEV